MTQLSRTSLRNDYRRTIDPQQMDRILLRAIQSWELWWQCSFGLQSVSEEDLQPFPREEVELAVAAVYRRGWNTSRNSSSWWGTITCDLIEICDRIWRKGEWPNQWIQSLIITLPEKGNLQLCQNYRTVSLISHSSKVMLKIILNPMPKRKLLKNRPGS